MSGGKNTGAPWSMIIIAMAFGIVIVGLANMDRVIWNWTSHGERLPGQVVDLSSFRTSPGATYLTFVPRVKFTDPGGQPREMNVANGSRYYDFRLGDRVTVLWRAETQSIAIDLPFKRSFGMQIFLWGLTLVGLALLGFALWMALERVRLRKRY
ncbi:hypothetical protein C8N43_0855 [Litoreibacter ponti]|uniref:DUF3592 domain-containing protein n=1 Tax=Litoreibacter ponti TaxID=1510457 RepID=A0A2T6BJI8_9RHOB|nr:DUF3592 domain-containing protein [Litoreibacter ponti]PTX56202.1 hypothetical protein C8N43_0855 [Litoreibacter ponti]